MELRGHRRAKKPQGGFFRRHYCSKVFPSLQGAGAFTRGKRFHPGKAQFRRQASSSAAVFTTATAPAAFSSPGSA